MLRLARCQERDPWDDGFVVNPGDNGAPVEVYFCEADEPDEQDHAHEPGSPRPLDTAAELGRYAEALTAAGYRVGVDTHDKDVLQIHR